jgi:type III secretion control protein HpaP
MHTNTTHRARVIAQPHERTDHRQHAPTTLSAQLSRQAALFRRLHHGAGADATPDDAPETAGAQSQEITDWLLDHASRSEVEVEVEPHGERESRDDRDEDTGDRDPEHAEEAADEPGFSHAATVQPDPPRIAGVAAPHRAHAHYHAPVTAVEAPARAGNDPHPFVESIVAQVADFCSNPAVLTRGAWHITIPIAPHLLPACTLSLTLSHFDLTLRFDTTEERSQQLILQHAAMLTDSLEQVMQSRFDTPRNIEVIVT